MSDEDERETSDVEEFHVTMPEQLAERLTKQYSAALSVPEGIRMAVDDAVENREREITSEDITEATIDALESGSIEVEVTDEPE